MNRLPETELRQTNPLGISHVGPFRVETVIVAFFIVISLLEIFAIFGRHGGKLTETQGQVLHVCGNVALALSAVALVRRLHYLPKVTKLLSFALALMLLGQILDLLRSIPQFAGIPWVSDDGPYGTLVNSSLQSLGLGLFGAGVYISLIELNNADGRLRFVLTNMPVMLDAVDGRGVFLVWNRECERVTGYSAAEIIGNPNAMEMLYPSGSGPPRFPTSQPIPEDYRDWECVIRCKDGNQKTISWSSQSKSFSLAGWATWGVGIDVSLARTLEEELLRIERSDAVGRLVGGIAGRFELLIVPLKGQLQSLKAEGDARSAPILDEALERIQRMNDTVRKLVVLGRTGRTRHRPIELRPLMEHAIEQLREKEPSARNVAIQLDLGELSLNGAIPPEDFDRAFTAVLRNALEEASGPKSVRPIVVVSWTEIVETGRPPGHFISTGSTHRRRPTTVISIRDFGGGVPPEILDKATEPFTTSRTPFEHAGLGLAVAQCLLRRARGRVELLNESEGGCTARMWIPNEPSAPTI